jgi:hypothetical protein
MPEEKRRDPKDVPAWWRGTDEEPEPDWAEQIRQGRKARGERLKDVFATFEDDADPRKEAPSP